MTQVALSKKDHLASHIFHTRRPAVGRTRLGLNPRESKLGLIKTSDSPQIRFWKTLGVWTVVAAFTMPVFRSGGRTGLTFFGWIKNHTIWGDPVEYVPEEDYAAELS